MKSVVATPFPCSAVSIEPCSFAARDLSYPLQGLCSQLGSRAMAAVGCQVVERPHLVGLRRAGIRRERRVIVAGQRYPVLGVELGLRLPSSLRSSTTDFELLHLYTPSDNLAGFSMSPYSRAKFALFFERNC